MHFLQAFQSLKRKTKYREGKIKIFGGAGVGVAFSTSTLLGLRLLQRGRQINGITSLTSSLVLIFPLVQCGRVYEMQHVDVQLTRLFASPSFLSFLASSRKQKCDTVINVLGNVTSIVGAPMIESRLHSCFVIAMPIRLQGIVRMWCLCCHILLPTCIFILQFCYTNTIPASNFA